MSVSSKYVLFTGATGLLGEYLLRDGLQGGLRYAVVVRPTRLESARSRIESMLARCEKTLGVSLPRPVVLEGNLSEPYCGLSKENRQWVKQHCRAVLHNAASLIFYTDEKGEPYKSNVDGTRIVLDFAESSGIRKFFHVSTAYIAGLRTGTCFENELDVGQEFGNDYEKSKVASEAMVRSVAFLDSLTVFRPAIIIGDSQTAYTSTYHGFYTPLKVVHALLPPENIEQIDGSPLLWCLGFSGSEAKNFVPVDWVATVMNIVILNEKMHGETYHLVPRSRVTVRDMMHVFEEALKTFFRHKPKKKTMPIIDTENMLETFSSQMQVYQSYWKNDPVFDYSNVERVVPCYPCPTVDVDMLYKMSMFALETGFGYPKKPPVVPPLELDAFFRGRSSLQALPTTPFALQVNGQGGGQWTLSANGITEGLPVVPCPLIYMNSATFCRIKEKTLSVSDAVRCGAVAIQTVSEANVPTLPQIEKILHHIL